MAGTWTLAGSEITLQNQSGPKECGGAGRFTVSRDGPLFGLDLIADDCQVRRMILDRSRWLPPGVVPVGSARRIVRAAGTAKTPLRQIAPGSGDWPSFRGREASGISEKQNLPDTWNPSTGENILWRTPIPGLAHSSPIVWGDTIFVTSAISERANATFKPGLYGDGDASDDRSRSAGCSTRSTSAAARSAGSGSRRKASRATSATSSPPTRALSCHRRQVVVAWFGSQGIYAYDFDGGLRWSVDLGRVDMGAYDIPAYEWGRPARRSSGTAW
jgi:hypothetical protein